MSIDVLLAEIEAENEAPSGSGIVATEWDDPPPGGADPELIMSERLPLELEIGPQSHVCDVSETCHRLLGVDGNGYKYGWLATDVAWCARRRRLKNSYIEEVKNG